MKKKLSIIFLSVALFFCACSETTPQNDGGYTLYFTNSNATVLSDYSYNASSKDALAIVKEFFDSMQGVLTEGSVSVIPTGIKYSGAELNGDILNVFLTGDLDSVPARQKMLFYAAFTRSVAQLAEVEGLILYCNGEGVTDGAGTNMGILKASRFVSDAAYDPNDYRESEVVLYFASAENTGLVKTPSLVAYRSTSALERVIVEKIIEGPSDESLSATVSPTLTLLAVNVRDKICYVNFDDKFVTETTTAYDYIPVYSIVNSLTELDGIDSVQISINGSSDITMPHGEISLSQPFTYSDLYVEK